MVNKKPNLLEAAAGNAVLGEIPLAFAYPRPLGGLGLPEHRLAYVDSASGERLGATVLLSESFRATDASIWSTEGGMVATGSKGPAAFFLDARMYSEFGGAGNASYDREDVDAQADTITGSVSYRSYARYRANADFDSPIGRFTLARDAVHWGPGLFTNLVFHENAVPFNQVRYAVRLGPLAVTSLYGDLVIGETQGFSDQNRKDRNLYAHRYELSLGPNLLAGISEQLILYDLQKSFLFVPVFPLFIAKGTMHEESNNGNIAADLTYRVPGLGMVYGEFLIDDLESPSSLFLKDYVQNKWAAMAGFHCVWEAGGGRAGWIEEFSRVEPWVYTHFDPGTSQAANLGYPLGNPYGPNSMALVSKVYFRRDPSWYAGLKVDAVWKGTGPGSSVEDAYPRDPLLKKNFLAGADARFSAEPEVSCGNDWIVVDAVARIGDGPGIRLAARVSY